MDEVLAKGEDGTCETVTIKTANGPVRINKADFVEGKDELFVEPKAEAPAAKESEPAPTGAKPKATK